MKKKSFLIATLVIAFCSGYSFKSIFIKPSIEETKMKKVTGIGGIFFKCKDPEKVKEWYNKHLGLEAGPYGASFEWLQSDDPGKKGTTQWNTFSDKTKYFEPSTKDFMINYRVDDLDALVEELKREGVTVVDKIESYDYGKFVHIIDLEGNKIQLWEAID